MPVLPPDIEAKYFRVLAVLEEVAHLRSSTRFGGGARLMLNVLHKALTRLSKELDSLVSGTDAEKRAASGCASAASYIHHALQLVQGADEDRAPNSLVEPLETLAQQYMPGCRLLVRAAYDGGLMAYWCEFFVPWLQKLLSLIPGDGDLGQMVQGLVSVVFPSAEKENLLMHAILGHKLGHAFSGVLVAPDELPVRLTPETEEWLSQPSNDEGRMVFNNLVVQWRDELLADAWGLHIMGPAYYFACSAAISNTSSSETHPSGPFRLGWLRRQLKRRGYLSQETTVGKWLQQYVEQESKAPILPAIDNALAEKCFSNAEQCLGGIADELFSAVAQTKKELAYEPGMFEKASEELIERLCNLVPPNELTVGKVNLPDVLNAGWLVRLCRWEDFCEASGDADSSQDRFRALAKLNGLLLKALEYLAVVEQWSAAEATS